MDLLGILLILIIFFALLSAARHRFDNVCYNGGGGVRTFQKGPKNPIPPWYCNSIYDMHCLRCCGQKIEWDIPEGVLLKDIRGACGCTDILWRIDTSTIGPQMEYKESRDETS